MRVKNNFIGKNVADVALGDERPNQIAPRELFKDLRDVGAVLGENLLRGGFIGAREDGGKAGGVAHQHDGLTGHG